jgi:hypothetical protein
LLGGGRRRTTLTKEAVPGETVSNGMKRLLNRHKFTILMAGWMMVMVAARATTVVPTTFSEMVSRAEMIVTGEVLSRRCEWTGTGSERCIVTVVTVQVQRVHKGTPPARLELQFLGGTVGDATLEVPGVPQFKIGERSILFVEKNRRTFCPLAGVYHGKLTIEREPQTGREILVRYNRRALTDTREIGVEDASPTARASGAPESARQPLSVDEFARQIRQELRNPSP